MLLVGILAATSAGSPFEYNSDLLNVEKLQVHADVSNILITESDSTMKFTYIGHTSLFGDKPAIDVQYSGNQAEIKVKSLAKAWKSLLPGIRKRGTLVLSIPSTFIEQKTLRQLQIYTGNGNIEVKNSNSAAGKLFEVDHLGLSSNVGNIKVDSFKGTALKIDAKNGSIHLGVVDGEVNITNRTGNLNGLTLSDIKGKNNIQLSNGKVKLTLPQELNLKGIGLNIETKNGRIVTNNNHLSNLKPTKQNAGQKITQPGNGSNELNISVMVGSIEIS